MPADVNAANAREICIFATDMASIEVWVERAFDAPDLQSIFDSN
jgi:hypothetical protein